MMQKQLMEELPTSKLDTRTLSLISTRDEAALMRMAKNLVRRLRGDVVPATAAEQDANPSGVPGEPWRALCMRLKVLQSKAKDAMDRERERDRYERTESRGEGTRATARPLSGDEFSAVCSRWVASPASGHVLPEEHFLPDHYTLGAFRAAFTQNKAEGECWTIEWPGAEELPLTRVGALKGPHARGKGAAAPPAPTLAYQVVERWELRTKAAAMASVDLPLPAAYTVPSGAAREIFSHAAATRAASAMRLLLSTVQPLGEELAKKSVEVACDAFDNTMRTSVLNKEAPTLAVAKSVSDLEGHLVAIRRDVVFSKGPSAPAASDNLLAASQGEGPPLTIEGIASMLQTLSAAAQASAAPPQAASARGRRGKRSAEAEQPSGVTQLLKALRSGGQPAQAPGPNNERNRASKAAKKAAKAPGGAGIDALLKALNGGGAAAAKAAATPPAAAAAPSKAVWPKELLAALAAAVSPTEGKERCRDFMNGKCFRGAACNYSHDK